MCRWDYGKNYEFEGGCKCGSELCVSLHNHAAAAASGDAAADAANDATDAAEVATDDAAEDAEED